MGNYVVYKHTSPSGKVYVGITGQNPEKRWQSGSAYRAKPFRNAIQKYGWENIQHEVLFEGLTLEEANQKEIELIAEYDSTNPKKGYNITKGGNCRFLGENHPLYGKKRPPEVVEKLRECRAGKPWTENQKRAAVRYFATHRAWNYGQTTPKEIREKLSAAHIGQCRPHTEETKRKISAGNDRFKKPVLQYSLDGTQIARYASISEAARVFGGKKHIKENIRQCCYSQRKSACGYKWMFVEEVENECMISNL